MEIIILWLALSILASVIAERKGNSGAGAFFLSILLSPLVGIIYACACGANKSALDAKAVNSGAMKTCPYCMEMVKRGAVICPHCRNAIAVQPSASSARQPNVTARVTQKWLVRRKGEELGEMSKSLMERKVKAGELDVVDDTYFDREIGEWQPIGVLVDV